ncbi:MAG: VCBS repeat-containing protein [Lutibacter sp.]
MNRIVTFLFIIFFISCDKNPEKGLFTPISSNYSHINFINKLSDSKSLNALDYMYFYDGGGVAVGDINNDGLPDLYFTANKGKNKLYLNKGNFVFEDITQKAGVAGNSDWNTGVVMADVNGDGYLDIYVCAVVGIHNFKGHNELFINQHNNTFKEQSARFNLNIQSQANNAAFFDYDKDGDLDMYLLNEGKHSATSFGPADTRKKINKENGDQLYKNEDGKFINVSQQAGIYSAPNSYGLGVVVCDFNNDGWDDLYISNDFHEDDYYYINNKNGTFTEQLKSHFGKTSRFSMGNDAADINHDGYQDIMTLDMLPKQEKYLKSSLTDDDFYYHKIRAKLGYKPQFSRNMLQINHQGQYFTDQALFSGVAATDWSWAPLLADFNLDGEMDLFVSNGIHRRLNDLDYLKIVTNKATKRNISSSRLFDNQVLNKMPEASVANFIFKGTKTLKFIDETGTWIPQTPSSSSGSVYADLDNDGDLDLVINNYNAKPTILKNNTKNKSYLKLQFKTSSKNKFGIGTKVFAYCNKQLQSKQLNLTRGFQSSVEPIIYFGFNHLKKIDSLVVVWPDNTIQKFLNVKTNQSLTLEQKTNKKAPEIYPPIKNHILFTAVKDTTFLKLKHQENRFSELSLNPILPYTLSNQGPAFAVTSGKEKNSKLLFVGGATHFPSRFYLLNELGIKEKNSKLFNEDKNAEDVSALFFDADGDGDKDLYVVTGGNEFNLKSSVLKDRLYLNDGNNNFKKSEGFLPNFTQNGSFVKANDIDKDGDLDLFVGGRSVPNKFGTSPKSYLLINNGKGKFSIAKSMLSSKIGMLTDAVFTDFNQDGYDDLIVVGEWMPPKFYKNIKGHFREVNLLDSVINNYGLWQAITPYDIDLDGDTDYLLGNWGLNTKFLASGNHPLKLYVGDFLKNGNWQTLLSIYKNGNYYSFNNKDQMNKAFNNYFSKKFHSYKDFAGKSFEEIIDKKWLTEETEKTVSNLASGYLKNNNGKFTFIPFSNSLQQSPITSFTSLKINNNSSVLCTGNIFSVPPIIGKLDGNLGALISNKTAITNGIQLGLKIGNVQVKKAQLIKLKNKKYLIIVTNNDLFKVYLVK